MQRSSEKWQKTMLKKAILESVTPKIREFIEGQLLENSLEEELGEESV